MRVSRTRHRRRPRGRLFIFLRVIAAVAVTAGAALGVAWIWYDFGEELALRVAAAVPQQEYPYLLSEAPVRVTPVPPVWNPGSIRATPIDRPEFPYARGENAEPADDSHFEDAIFFGDSLTAALSFYGIAPGAGVMAFAGDHPGNIHERTVRVEGELLPLVQAAKILYGERGNIYILFSAASLTVESEKFLEGYAAFIDAVRYYFPHARIFVQSIPPITYEAGISHPRLSNALINEYNLELMHLSRQKGAIFLDIAEALTDATGHLSPHAAPADGIHFNAEHYYIWFDYLRRHW